MFVLAAILLSALAVTPLVFASSSQIDLSGGCQQVTRSNSVYLLTQDVQCGDGPAISFLTGLTNVTLDCLGHHVFGVVLTSLTQGSIVITRGDSSITVKDCILDRPRGAFYETLNGVTVEGASGVTIANSYFSSSFWSGVRVDGSRNVTIKGNQFIGNIGGGVYANDSSGLSIVSNEVDHSFIGIQAYDVSNSSIELNRSAGNNFTSIFLGGDSSGNKIWGNWASSNLDGGIVLGYDPALPPPNHNLISDNVCQANLEGGIILLHADFNNVTGNTVVGNSPFGIWLDDGYLANLSNIGNRIESNTILSNGQYPILLDRYSGSDVNVVKGNKIGNMQLNGTSQVALLPGVETEVTLRGRNLSLTLEATTSSRGFPQAALLINGKALTLTPWSPVDYGQGITQIRVVATYVAVDLFAYRQNGAMLTLTPARTIA